MWLKYSHTLSLNLFMPSSFASKIYTFITSVFLQELNSTLICLSCPSSDTRREEGAVLINNFKWPMKKNSQLLIVGD